MIRFKKQQQNRAGNRSPTSHPPYHNNSPLFRYLNQSGMNSDFCIFTLLNTRGTPNQIDTQHEMTLPYKKHIINMAYV